MYEQDVTNNHIDYMYMVHVFEQSLATLLP